MSSKRLTSIKNFIVLKPLEELDTEDKVKEEIKRLKKLASTHSDKFGCYAYLATIPHFDIARTFAKKHIQVKSLMRHNGLLRKEELEEAVHFYAPEFVYLVNEAKYEAALESIHAACQNKLRKEYYDMAVGYIKGAKIMAAIAGERYEEALEIAETIRFVDVRMSVKALVKERKAELSHQNSD